MISLVIPRSRSEKYPTVSKMAHLFTGIKTDDDGLLRMDLSVKEVFERWDTFNTIFWTVVKWKGTYMVVDGARFFSHRDMTGIFYNLQLSKMKWINFVEARVRDAFDPATGRIELAKVDEKTADYLIDLFCIVKQRGDTF